MYRYFILLVFLLFKTNIISQNTNFITGKIIDENTKDPISYAAILIKGTNRSVITDSEGNFKILAKDKTTILIIVCIGYNTKELKVEEKDYDNVLIPIKNQPFLLETIEVVSKKIDSLQYKTNTICTAFEFYDNYIIALVNKGKAVNYIQVMEDDGTIIAEKKTPPKVESLLKDCFGNIQLISKDSSYQFYYDYEKIVYHKGYPIEEYNAKLKYCQCVFKNFIYFKEVKIKGLKHIYFYINTKNPAKRHLISELSDESALLAIRKFEDIGYFLRMRTEMIKNDAPIEDIPTVDEIKENLEYFMDVFPLSPNLKNTIFPINSEMVKTDSAVYTIDYFNKRIKKYNFFGINLKVDSIPLQNLKPKVLQDERSNTIYFVKEFNGITNLFEYNDYKNGYNQKTINEFKFLKNLRCRNGNAYFIYRDPINPNNKLKIFKYSLLNQ